MPRQTRSYTPQALDAARTLGNQIAIARRERGWTAAELAERVGITPRTLYNLERGRPSVAMGVAFEAATLLGIRLFGVEGPELAELAKRGSDTLALLPIRVYHSRKPVNDDF